MRFIDRLRRAKNAYYADVNTGTGDLYGVFVQDGRVRPLSYSPFVRGINMISDNAAQLMESIHIVGPDGLRLDSRSAREMVATLTTTLDDGETAAFYFWKQEYEDLLSEGRAIMRPVFNRAGRLLRIDRIAGRRVQWDQALRLYWGPDTLESDYRNLYFSEKEVAHAKWGPANPADPRFSIAPIEKLRDTILTAQNAQKWLSDFFKSNFKTNLVISPSGKAPFSTEDMKRLESLVSKYLRGEAPLIVGRGASVEQIDQKATDQQTIQVMEFLVSETARMFNLPKQLLGIGEIKGVGVLYDEYWRTCLSPTVHKMLTPLSLRMLRPGYRFKVDETASLIRGSLSELTNFMNAIRPNTGTMPMYTVNELRAKLGDSPLSDEQFAELLREHREFFAQRQSEAPGSDDSDADEDSDGDESVDNPDREEVE